MDGGQRGFEKKISQQTMTKFEKSKKRYLVLLSTSALYDNVVVSYLNTNYWHETQLIMNYNILI